MNTTTALESQVSWSRDSYQLLSCFSLVISLLIMVSLYIYSKYLTCYLISHQLYCTDNYIVQHP